MDPKLQTYNLTAAEWVGDDTTAHWFRAPSTDDGGGVSITEIYGVNGAATGAGTGFALQIENWGTAGTAMEGTVMSSMGGTADPWAADVPKAGTIVDSYVGAGEWVVIRKNETNSSDPTFGVLSAVVMNGK